MFQEYFDEFLRDLDPDQLAVFYFISEASNGRSIMNSSIPRKY